VKEKRKSSGGFFPLIESMKCHRGGWLHCHGLALATPKEEKKIE